MRKSKLMPKSLVTIAAEMTAFANLIDCEGVKVDYLESAGGLWRVKNLAGECLFYATQNEACAAVIKIACEQHFIRLYKKDSQVIAK